MTLTQAFYLFILPLLIAAAGGGIAWWYGSRDDNRLHPGE